MLKDVYRATQNSPELYVPQQNMLDTIQTSREKGIDACYVDVATGVGKTYAIAHDIKRYLEEKPDARVLYLCHKGQVLEQARETISDLIDPSTSHGNFYGGMVEDQEQVVYATFRSMTGGNGDYKNYEAFDPTEFDYIVVDESHHGPAPTYAEVIDYFKPEFQIGLTATEERMDGQDISKILGPKIFQYTLEEAIAEEVLVKPDYRLFTEHEASLKDILEDEEVKPTLNEINDRLGRVTKDENYQQAILSEIESAKAEHENPRTVIYCPDIEYAEMFSEHMDDGKTLHSKLSDEEKKARLEAFRKGELPTLLVVDIFNEGIDVPEINTMVFLRGTESKTVFLQQLGRGLRTSEGKDRVIALDFATSWQRIMLIADLKDDVQKIYKKNKQTGRKHSSKNIIENLDTNDMVPFDFSFSKDALDAVNIIQKVRKEKNKLINPNHGKRLEQHNNDELLLQEMFDLGPYDPEDPNNALNLPNQRMTLEEENRLGARIAMGDKEAQEQYIMRRLRAVLSKARAEFNKQPPGSTLTLEDHFQNGLESLVVALDTYNATAHKKQPNIRKYFGINMWGGIQKPAKYTANTIRIPFHIQEEISTMNKIIEKYIAENGGSEGPDNDKLAQLLGYKPWEVDKIIELKYLKDQMYNGIFDEDDKIKDQSEYGSADIINEVSDDILSEQIELALSRLSDRDREVVKMRNSFDRRKSATLDEVSKTLGFTRERVRQIEHASLKQLRVDSRSMTLRGSQDIAEGEFLNQNLPPSQYKIEKVREKLATGNYWSSETVEQIEERWFSGGDRRPKTKAYLEEFMEIWGNQTGSKRTSLGGLAIDMVRTKLWELDKALEEASGNDKTEVLNAQLATIQKWFEIIRTSNIWEDENATSSHLAAIKNLIDERSKQLQSGLLRTRR